MLCGKAVAASLEERIHHFAVDIQLQLGGRGVANADRFGTFVAGEPRDFPFIEAPLAAEAIHDLHLCGITGHGTPQPLPPRSASR